jgi:hypothetical protein
MAVIIKLDRVRGSFLKLGEPEQFEAGKGPFRWSATALVMKSDTAQIKKVEAALEAVAIEKWGPKAKQMLNAILGDKGKCCWLDGDKSANDGYAGCMSLASHRAQEKGRPLVFDSNMEPIYDIKNMVNPGKGGRLYSGCYINAEFEIWAQDNNYGKGLRATLCVVQRAGHGDAFGGGTAPTAENFGEVAEGADAGDLD